MLTKAHHFGQPAMLTLTVDRSHYESPEQAHQQITQNSYISRLMRLLGVVTWFWVLEIQTKSGSGWPHWHLLIDLDDVNGAIDLQRAWKLWRDKWHLGGLDLSMKRSFADRGHAVNYVTKYLTKTPEAFPIWVIDSQRVVRFVGGCKALGSLTGQPPRERIERDEEEDPQLKLFREPRTLLLVRMARCGMKSTVFGVDGNCDTGEGGWQWMARIDCTPNDLIEMAEQGLVSLRVAAVDWGESELLVLTEKSIGGVFAALGKLPAELADRENGYAEEWCGTVAERERMIHEHHADFWQARAA